MKWLPWVLLALGFLLYGRERQASGRLAERLAQLGQHKAQVDTLYRRDTLTLTKVRRVTDSILSTDTLYRVDTVRQLVAAERKACDAAVSSCEQRVAVRDSIITALKKAQPGRFGCTAGVAVNQKGFGPGASCGIRF